MRGGFRYVNIYLVSGSNIIIQDVKVNYLAAPRMKDPSNYRGSFESDQPLLNKVWYGSAYTIQLCTIDPSMGRIWPPPATQWDNSVLVGIASSSSSSVVNGYYDDIESMNDDDDDDDLNSNITSILVDGAKRDRTIWPGDMGIASLTSYVTIGDTFSPRQSLETLFEHQDNDSGMLPWVGPAVFCQVPEGTTCPDSSGSYASDTYHLWTLIGASDYFTYSNNDLDFISNYWNQFQLALNCSIGKIRDGDNGLMYVTATADWARNNQGGENVAANGLLVAALEGGANLALLMNHEQLSSYYSDLASTLKQTLMDGESR
jgi:hypothetical protein